MAKLSVNLIIKREAETAFLRKLKVVLPILAVAGLALFVIIFFVSLLYINNNTSQFNLLKRETQTLEKKISDNKNTEGIYTMTLNRLHTLSQVVKTARNFWPLIEEISKLQGEGVSITQVTAEKTGSISLSVTASSAATLDSFVVSLISAESKKLLSEINTGGIVRDKNGAYFLTVTAKANQTLLQ